MADKKRLGKAKGRLRSFRKDKRGVIFTVLAIVLSVFFTTTFSARVEHPVNYRTEVVETRVKILNNYVENFFGYAQGAGSMAGYFALQGVITDMGNRTPKAYKPDFEEQFINCTMKGSLTSTRVCPDMQNKTIGSYLDRIVGLAQEELNINSSYTLHWTNISQLIGSFSVELRMNISLYIMDSYANISDNRMVVSMISIEGLQDPIYLVNGSYTQSIKKHPLEKVEDGGWDQTDLASMYYNSTYRKYSGGISIINRIKGNFTPSSLGIESLVNQSRVSYDVNDSMVDYLFWLKLKPLSCEETQNTNRTVVKINNTAIIGPSGFQIDEEHRVNFQISSSDTEFTC